MGNRSSSSSSSSGLNTKEFLPYGVRFHRYVRTSVPDWKAFDSVILTTIYHYYQCGTLMVIGGAYESRSDEQWRQLHPVRTTSLVFNPMMDTQWQPIPIDSASPFSGVADCAYHTSNDTLLMFASDMCGNVPALFQADISSLLMTIRYGAKNINDASNLTWPTDSRGVGPLSPNTSCDQRCASTVIAAKHLPHPMVASLPGGDSKDVLRLDDISNHTPMMSTSTPSDRPKVGKSCTTSIWRRLCGCTRTHDHDKVANETHSAPLAEIASSKRRSSLSLYPPVCIKWTGIPLSMFHGSLPLNNDDINISTYSAALLNGCLHVILMNHRAIHHAVWSPFGQSWTQLTPPSRNIMSLVAINAAQTTGAIQPTLLCHSDRISPNKELELATGGYLLAVNTASGFERYDPNTNQWQSLLPSPQPRYHATPVVTHDSVYYIGGFDKNGGSINTIDSWSCTQHCWKQTTFSTPPGRWLTNFAAEFVCGHIWLIGGRHYHDLSKRCWALDISNSWSQWQPVPPLPQPQFGMASAKIWC